MKCELSKLDCEVCIFNFACEMYKYANDLKKILKEIRTKKLTIKRLNKLLNGDVKIE